MSESRRNILRYTLAFACAASCAAVQAETAFPSKPLTLYVAFAPGGAGDIVARLVTRKMSESMGQPFVIENRPSPVVAVQTVQRAKPDGYTMVMAGSGTALTTALFKKLPYDLMKDFRHVSSLSTFDLALITGTESGFKSVSEVIAYAKVNPGKLNIGTVRVGSTQNLSAEMFKSMTGIEASVVPYRTTAEVISGLRSKDIQVAMEMLPPLLGQISGGSVKPLAVSSMQRYPGLPDIPTLNESGVKDYESGSWNGVSVPAGTPTDVVNRLASEIDKAVNSPDVQKELLKMGMRPDKSSPELMTRRMQADIDKWRGVIKNAHIPLQ
ncbi:tripartite tricarboxylate transporter substrate binding protein (plasmid) [Diaphorobacter sp. HDW4B]|uniref:Bug family tripartite tricarboxylate transporter substrate binding protein n=1 Tax=Diaphorobacter sp. HDW4B TaxID=2714925 RepID=UPI001409A083|nr:tripartite tricarboxylate transporter substrate-binding protein [Diaphorobacter sp. HDW4B]QIL73879.1 tripartite tricarboxylate transporter substrate binding protein [Diaphorobacter sp. HDW4B]